MCHESLMSSEVFNVQINPLNPRRTGNQPLNMCARARGFADSWGAGARFRSSFHVGNFPAAPCSLTFISFVCVFVRKVSSPLFFPLLNVSVACVHARVLVCAADLFSVDLQCLSTSRRGRSGGVCTGGGDYCLRAHLRAVSWRELSVLAGRGRGCCLFPQNTTFLGRKTANSSRNVSLFS